MNEVFQALSDPTRRQILKLLRQEDMSAGDIADQFQISKPSVSHHLSTLKNASLIIGVKKGQHIIYSLNTTMFQEIIEWFFDFKQRSDQNETE